MKAAIIAGGKGTRLEGISRDIPKPMFPVAGKPVLEYQIDLLKSYGITDILLIVNHLKESIINHFGDGSSKGINITYFEESEPLGTVGGLREASDYFTEDFLVLYGDVLVNMNLQKLMDYHRNKSSECTLVVHPNDHPFDSDLLEADAEGRITAFHPKPHPENSYFRNLVNAALYVMSPEFIRSVPIGVKADFGRDIFPLKVHTHRMFAYNTSEYLKDMGTPDRLGSVEKDILSGKFERARYGNPRPAVFLDRDGVLNEDSPDFIKNPDELHLLPGTADAVKHLNKAGFLTVVVTNQSGLARNLFTEDGLNRIHAKLEWELGMQHARLDALYYCPHHPHAGFEGENKSLKINCDCRKPKPGMLLQAAKEHSIELAESYMIGDSFRDIEAGKAAGVITVGVRTGNGCKDATHPPDYMFDTLLQAAEHISTTPNKRLLQTISKRLGSNPQGYILIGGNSRSGKSTLSTDLKIHLRRNGIRCTVYRLDDHIKPQEERSPEENYLGRFRFADAEHHLIHFLHGANKPQGMILVEGVPALASEKLRSRALLSIHCRIDEKLRKQRIQQYYRFKGLSDAEIDTLYHSRTIDEYQPVEILSQYADIITDEWTGDSVSG